MLQFSFGSCTLSAIKQRTQILIGVLEAKEPGKPQLYENEI